MSMLDAPERARPIMYVRHLKSRVRQYQAREGLFRLHWFSLGFAAGGAAVGTGFAVVMLFRVLPVY
jgi:hypothetical protein